MGGGGGVVRIRGVVLVFRLGRGGGVCVCVRRRHLVVALCL